MPDSDPSPSVSPSPSASPNPGPSPSPGSPSPDDLPLRPRLLTGLRLGAMTAVAAWICYASTSLLGLHEGFWAAVSAIVVMQSDVTTTVKSGRDRFIGTAIGGVLGWVCALGWHHHVWIYAVAIALTLLICWWAKLSGAGRLAAVTVTVIVLIPQSEALWKVALFRFGEVSWGIVVAVGIQLGVNWLEARRRTQ